MTIDFSESGLARQLIEQLTEDDIKRIRNSSKQPKTIQVPGKKSIIERVFGAFMELNGGCQPVTRKSILEKLSDEKPNSVRSAIRILRNKELIGFDESGNLVKGALNFSRKTLKGSKTDLMPSLRAYVLLNGIEDGKLVPIEEINSYFFPFSTAENRNARAKLNRSGLTVTIGSQFVASPIFYRPTGPNSFYSYNDDSEYIVLSPEQLELLYLFVTRGPLDKEEISDIFYRTNGRRLKDESFRRFRNKLLKKRIIQRIGDVLIATREGARAYQELAKISPITDGSLERKYRNSGINYSEGNGFAPPIRVILQYFKTRKGSVVTLEEINEMFPRYRKYSAFLVNTLYKSGYLQEIKTRNGIGYLITNNGMNTSARNHPRTATQIP